MRLGLLVAAMGLLVGCAQPAAEDADQGDQAATAGEAPKLCAAMRGNGEYIVTHFSALARITESYGIVDGIAGGSSGSISTFIYDSILQNPVVMRGTGAEKAANVALLLKSLQGYGEVVVASKEGSEVGELAGTIGRLKDEMSKRGIAALISTDTVKAASELKAVLSIPEVKTLVNPEAFTMLTDVTHLSFNVKELYTSLVTLGAFSVDDNRLFFRPGILNWDGLADLFGRVGDFYAGERADTDAQEKWLNQCAGATLGQSWEQISGTACGTQFQSIVTEYRAKVRASGAKSIRLTERIGQPSLLHKFVATSVLDQTAAKTWEDANEVYRSGSVASGSIPFEPGFEHVQFGYWSSAADYQKASNAHRYSDLKTSKMTSLGDSTWKEILSASPAEPGLSRFVKLADGRMSAGGWSDLAPVLMLKNLGCERVIYVTREGDESEFAMKIAKHLGMSADDFGHLYELNGQSSFSQSLAEADGVWCTNWNSFTDFQQKELAADAWQAPLETHAGFAGISMLSAYPNTTSSVDKPGCSPATPGSAKYPQ
jgi:hypothetical protein